MFSREISVTKSPVGTVIKVRRNNETTTSVLLESDEWTWVKEVVDDLDMGKTQSRTFVM